MNDTNLSKLFNLLNGFSLKSTNDRFEVLQVHVIQEEMKDFPLVFMRIKQQTIKRKLWVWPSLTSLVAPFPKRCEISLDVPGRAAGLEKWKH